MTEKATVLACEITESPDTQLVHQSYTNKPRKTHFIYSWFPLEKRVHHQPEN